MHDPIAATCNAKEPVCRVSRLHQEISECTLRFRCPRVTVAHGYRVDEAQTRLHRDMLSAGESYAEPTVARRLTRSQCNARQATPRRHEHTQNAHARTGARYSTQTCTTHQLSPAYRHTPHRGRRLSMTRTHHHALGRAQLSRQRHKGARAGGAGGGYLVRRIGLASIQRNRRRTSHPSRAPGARRSPSSNGANTQSNPRKAPLPSGGHPGTGPRTLSRDQVSTRPERPRVPLSGSGVRQQPHVMKRLYTRHVVLCIHGRGLEPAWPPGADCSGHTYSQTRVRPHATQLTRMMPTSSKAHVGGITGGFSSPRSTAKLS